MEDGQRTQKEEVSKKWHCQQFIDILQAEKQDLKWATQPVSGS